MVVESSWLACLEPQKLFKMLRHSRWPSGRKQRLFAAACVR